jgi:hypothetical protein
MKILPSPERCRRLAVALALLGAVIGFYVWRTWWWPDLEVQTEHYAIRSTATRAQTEDAGRALETLYAEYMGLLGDLPGLAESEKPLEVCLYGNRDEFRRVNPRAGWAEALYRGAECHAYFTAHEANPYHWLLHEAVHQLNRQVAHLDLATWADEGLAEYFSASRYADGALQLGRPDPNAYPIWWVYEMGLAGDLQEDIAEGRIIPLRAIVSGRGGPDIDEKFNLYYIHWWSLTHFLIEADGGPSRDDYLRLIREGGSLGAFEQYIGPIERVQRRWYEYLCELYQQAIAGAWDRSDVDAGAGALPPP